MLLLMLMASAISLPVALRWGSTDAMPTSRRRRMYSQSAPLLVELPAFGSSWSARLHCILGSACGLPGCADMRIASAWAFRRTSPHARSSAIELYSSTDWFPSALARTLRNVRRAPPSAAEFGGGGGPVILSTVPALTAASIGIHTSPVLCCRRTGQCGVASRSAITCTSQVAAARPLETTNMSMIVALPSGLRSVA